jgi:hypothetical protein
MLKAATPFVTFWIYLTESGTMFFGTEKECREQHEGDILAITAPQPLQFYDKKQLVSWLQKHVSI